MSISTPQRRREDSVTIRRPAPDSIAAPTEPQPKRKRFRWVRWTLLFLLLSGGLAVSVVFFGNKSLKIDQTLVFYDVAPRDLAISIVERGTLESQENVQIHCEVDDVRGDNVEGTAIIWLIRNGASVKKDDLLVELASSSHQEQLDRQILDTQAAESAFLQTEAKYENQKTQNETTMANAQLQVDLAILDLEMFTDEESGTHQLEVEVIERLIEDINNDILASQANLKLKKNEMQGIDTLFKLGYAGKSELERSRLDYMQAESQYAAAMNKLSTQKATLQKKQIYEQKKQLLTLRGDLETAKRNLKQVELDNESLLTQAKAALDAAKQAFEKETERLTRYRAQVGKCKIYAPQDGMVVYSVADQRRWWLGEIREGGAVRPRQHILSLPNLEKMQVKTAVHESLLDEISHGLPASIRIEAFPDRVYHGSVKSVAVMADQSAETKFYETIVTIDEQVEQLKPGMTAVVDIHVERLRDVLAVPVQAIVQVEKDTWCYVDDGQNSVQRQEVKLGRTNDKFVEIREGLQAGKRVVLNPMAIVEAIENPESGPDQTLTPESSADQQPEGDGVLPLPGEDPNPANEKPAAAAARGREAGNQNRPQGQQGSGESRGNRSSEAASGGAGRQAPKGRRATAE